MPSTPPRWPSTSPPGSGRSWTTYFWTIIPFGTGGRRGKLYPIGTNAINDRTIGESAQGLADYVKDYVQARLPKSPTSEVSGRPLACADRLRHAAPVAALRRAVQRDHGGGGLHRLLPRRLPQHAGTVVRRALQALRLRDHDHRQPQSAQRQRGEGLLVYRRAIAAAARPGRDRPRDGGHADRADCRSRKGSRRGGSSIARRRWMPRSSPRCVAQSRPGPRDLKIIYSPLHGVGASAVCPVLAAAGFKDVEVFGPHAAPDPDFTNVPDHVANPERPAVFRRDHPAGPADRRRPDPGHRSRLRPARLRGPEVTPARTPPGPRSPATRSARCWPTTCWRRASGPARSRRSTTSSRPW